MSMIYSQSKTTKHFLAVDWFLSCGEHLFNQFLFFLLKHWIRSIRLFLHLCINCWHTNFNLLKTTSKTKKTGYALCLMIANFLSKQINFVSLTLVEIGLCFNLELVMFQVIFNNSQVIYIDLFIFHIYNTQARDEFSFVFLVVFFSRSSCVTLSTQCKFDVQVLVE